jgi:NO-binding membrane sensor protein with MHYT domain
MNAQEPPFASTMVRMFSGVIIWAVHFVGIYAFTALACTRGFESAAPWVIAIATVIAVAVAITIARASWRQPQLADWMTVSVNAIAIVAILFEALALIWVPVCGTR